MDMRKKLWWLVPLYIAALLVFALLLYIGNYYRADADAVAAMASDETIRVFPTDFGWLFDGPSETDALIFYPGGKVEAEAYAPLCRALAQAGADVCLVRMPLRISLLGENKADEIIGNMEYERWIIAGHSLGGVCAAIYASKHPEKLAGVVMLASYATQPLDDRLSALYIYGTEDGILNMERYKKNLANAPAHMEELVIEGGNHSQFGSYGMQTSDGVARITPDEQMEQTVTAIAGMIPVEDRGEG